MDMRPELNGPFVLGCIKFQNQSETQHGNNKVPRGVIINFFILNFYI